MLEGNEAATPRGRRERNDEEQGKKYSQSSGTEMSDLTPREIAVKALERAEKVAKENEELRSTIEEKDERIEEQDERIESLTRALAEHQRETEGNLDTLVSNVSDIEESVLGEYSPGLYELDNDPIEERVTAIERDQVSASDVVKTGETDALIPLQQMYGAVKNGYEKTIENENERRAAKIWPHFRDYADPSGGKLTLSSGKVRDILREKAGMPDPSANTVRRVMKFVCLNSTRDSDLPNDAGYTDDARFIKFYRRKEDDVPVNQLVCDREDWVEITGEMMQAATQEGAQTVATDGGRRTEGGITPS